MIQALLSNRNRPDMPPVPVCFPIGDYAGIYENLRSIGIGSVTVRDCFVKELGGDYPILKRLEETEINVDELDYLAKRLESFDKYELAQFQGAAVSRDFSNMTDLINLTFCCQGVTVIQDFTDLTAIGRKHYMNLHGGLTEDDLKSVDFRKTALSLLMDEEVTITPYGVVYENDMKLELYYDGLISLITGIAAILCWPWRSQTEASRKIPETSHGCTCRQRTVRLNAPCSAREFRMRTCGCNMMTANCLPHWLT